MLVATKNLSCKTTRVDAAASFDFRDEIAKPTGK